MAHYELKISCDSPLAMLATAERVGARKIFSANELDTYFKTFRADHFQKYRQYNPAIKISINPNTGEAWGAKGDKNAHIADWILSSRYILYKRDQKSGLRYSDISVLDVRSEGLAKNFYEQLKANFPVDCYVDKMRHVFWHQHKGLNIRTHVDEDVKKLGSFIEFEIKEDRKIVSEAHAEDTFAELITIFDLNESDIQKHNYRDLTHALYPHYSPLLATLPETALDFIKNKTEVLTVPKGEKFISFKDTSFDGYLIEKGQVEVFTEDDRKIRTIAPNDITGEWAVDVGFRTANVLASNQEDVVMRIIPKHFLEEVILSDSTISHHIRKRHAEDERNRLIA